MSIREMAWGTKPDLEEHAIALRLEVDAALRMLAQHAGFRGAGPALVPVHFRFILAGSRREVLIPVAAPFAQSPGSENGG